MGRQVTFNGSVEWLYKDFKVRFSSDNIVLGVFSLASAGTQSPTSFSTNVERSSEKSPFQLPANATLDYTGSSWNCIKGYRRNNNSCVLVNMLPNAQLDYTGKNWKCRKGYRRHGNGCGRVQIPPNAELLLVVHCRTGSLGTKARIQIRIMLFQCYLYCLGSYT